jgi:hypothetical protein
VWAAPTITTMARSGAQAGGSVCPNEQCAALARAIRIQQELLNTTIDLGESTGAEVCVLREDLPPIVEGRTICGRTFGGGIDDDAFGCGAGTRIQDLVITLPGLPVITADVLEAHVYNSPCPEGQVTSQIVGLQIGTLEIEDNIGPTVIGPIGVGNAVTATVAIKQTTRTCTNGLNRITHELVRITLTAPLLGTTTIVIGHVQSASTCCPCDTP